jgi:hypothetical protein
MQLQNTVMKMVNMSLRLCVSKVIDPEPWVIEILSNEAKSTSLKPATASSC